MPNFTAKKDISVTRNRLPFGVISKGTKIENAKCFAQGNGIDDIKRLCTQYKINGKDSPAKDWQKCKGETIMYINGFQKKFEVHWYQCKNIGKVEFKFKRFIYE